MVSTLTKIQSTLYPFVRVLLCVLMLAGLLEAINFGFTLLNQPSDILVIGGAIILALVVAICVGIIARTWHSNFLNGLKRTANRTVPIALLAVSVLFSVACSRTIPPGHAGIVVKQTGGDRGVSQIPVETGKVYCNPWNESVLDYPTFVQRAIWTASTKEGSENNDEISFQSSDQLHFTGDVAVAYQLVQNKVPAFYVQFRSDDIGNFTHGFFRDAVRKAIGLAAQHYTQEEINGGKQADLENEAQKTLIAAMEPYGVNIIQLAFTSPPRPPASVRTAIEGKIAATQKAEQIENEKRQAVGEGAKNVAYAEAQAKANNTITASITPALIQWEQLKVLQSKWDGRMPMVQGGGGQGVMFNLPMPGK